MQKIQTKARKTLLVHTTYIKEVIIITINNKTQKDKPNYFSGYDT